MLGGDPTLYYYSNSIRELNIDVYTKNKLTYADIYVVNKNTIIYQTTLSVVFEKQNEATIIVIEEERFIVGEKNNNTGRYLLTNFI